MIIETKEFQNVCKKILEAVDTDSTQRVSETLELEVVNKKMHLNVTNREYYVSVTTDINEDVGTFKAVVVAKLFLNLVAKITTTNIELTTDGNTLFVKANGTYKLPMIYDEDSVIELPKIEINNATSDFVVSGENLLSILMFNTNEIKKKIQMTPSMYMYYLDGNGCITYTRYSATVNSFTLNNDVKLLLNAKTVKLFKLFDNGDVNVTIGYDNEGGSLKQKARFETENVTLTVILNSDDGMINSVPVASIRKLADTSFKYNIMLRRTDVLDSLNRILLFKNGVDAQDVGTLEFKDTYVTIFDLKKDNEDAIQYANTTLEKSTDVEVQLDLVNLKNTLDGCNDEFLSFGISPELPAIVITRGNVKNVISKSVRA